MTDRDLIFLDTETLGLDRDAPIWEIAAIRRDATTGAEARLQVFVDHDPDPWLESLPEKFADDYLERFNPDAALSCEVAAAAVVGFISRGGHDRPPMLVGCNPRFDTERIEHLLLRPAGYPTPWHYMLCDTATLAQGYLHGVRRDFGAISRGVPHTSDGLSEALGIDPADYARHTAMGDVEWCRDQYDLITGTRSLDAIPTSAAARSAVL